VRRPQRRGRPVLRRVRARRWLSSTSAGSATASPTRCG
jgi:hypothetical protein